MSYDRDASTCCGQPLRFNPDMRGNTCGGLALIGWMMCDACGKGYLAPKGMWKLDDGSGAPWALAASGRSVTCGAIKVILADRKILPIVEHRVSIAPDGTRTPVVYRFGTVGERDRFDVVRRRAYHGQAP